MRRDELLLGDKCGGVRDRQPNGCFLDEAIYAGLRPADVLVYVKRSQGRANRPYQKRSTVAANSAAFCKSHTGYHGDKKNDSSTEHLFHFYRFQRLQTGDISNQAYHRTSRQLHFSLHEPSL